MLLVGRVIPPNSQGENVVVDLEVSFEHIIVVKACMRMF